MIDDTANMEMAGGGKRPEDAELLRRYAADRSEAAFAELVRRHLDLVYSVALRQVAGDAHLADAARRLRPMGIGAGQRGEMAFVIEARHVGIGLWPQPRRLEAARGHRVDEGQPPGLEQIVDERGDEDGLARPPQAGDADADRRFEEKPAAGVVQAVEVGNAHGRSFTSGR